MRGIRAFVFIALVALALDANGNDAEQKRIITDDLRGVEVDTAHHIEGLRG